MNISLESALDAGAANFPATSLEEKSVDDGCENPHVAHAMKANKVKCKSGTPRSQRSAFKPALKPSEQFKQALALPPASRQPYVQCLEDISALSKCALQAKYPHEYNSYRGAKYGSPGRHLHFDSGFRDFRDWLGHVGPQPGPGDSIDRIKTQKGYVRGNLRWAGKQTQTENRKVTRWHTLPDGRSVNTKQLARTVGKPYGAVYKQLQRGWSVERILADCPQDWEDSFPPPLRFLEPEYRKNHYSGQSRIDWANKYFLQQRLSIDDPQLRDEFSRRINYLAHEYRRLTTRAAENDDKRKQLHIQRLLEAVPAMDSEVHETPPPVNIKPKRKFYAFDIDDPNLPEEIVACLARQGVD